LNAAAFSATVGTFAGSAPDYLNPETISLSKIAQSIESPGHDDVARSNEQDNFEKLSNPNSPLFGSPRSHCILARDGNREADPRAALLGDAHPGNAEITITLMGDKIANHSTGTVRHLVRIHFSESSTVS
jgi:hypothetical protein